MTHYSCANSPEDIKPEGIGGLAGLCWIYFVIDMKLSGWKKSIKLV